MSKLRIACLSMSVDGYAAGPNQSLQNPLGEGGMDLHQWAFATRGFHAMHGQANSENMGETGTDDDFIARGFENIGAWILGRNMFGPVRGPWPGGGSGEAEWRGWWGDNPPYHVPVFVLTHHAREPLHMEGGTSFHFVTDGPEAALASAREAAQGKDLRIGGGAATIQQYLRAGLVDEMHIAIAPVLLGSGEKLIGDVNLRALGYQCIEHVKGARATHVVFGKDA